MSQRGFCRLWLEIGLTLLFAIACTAFEAEETGELRSSAATGKASSRKLPHNPINGVIAPPLYVPSRVGSSQNQQHGQLLTPRAHTTILTCQGHRYAIPSEAPFYSCCGQRVYYWPNETCTMSNVEYAAGNVVKATNRQQSLVETFHNCEGTVYPVPHSMRNFYACCGQYLYDTRSTTCNNNKIQNNKDSLSGTQLGLVPFQSHQQPHRQQQQQGPVVGQSHLGQHRQQAGEKLAALPGNIANEPSLQQDWAARLWRSELEAFAQQLASMTTPTSTSTTMPLTTTTTTTTTAPPTTAQTTRQTLVLTSPVCLPGYLCCKGYAPVFNANDRFKCCPGAGPYDPVASACILS